MVKLLEFGHLRLDVMEARWRKNYKDDSVVEF